MMTKREYVATVGGGLLMAAVAVGPAGCSNSGGEASGATAESAPQTVEVAEVEAREFQRKVESSTTLAPSRTLRVTPEVGGVAEKVYVEQGDSVEKGDPLVRIASVDYSLAVDSAKFQEQAAEAGIEQAKARLKTAKNQYERFEELYESDVVAKAQFEEVKSAYEQAKAGYETAKARAERASTGVEQAQTRVQDTVVRAPFDGHVVRRMVEEGAVLRPMASPTMVLVDDAPIRAEASVGELKLPQVEEGMEADVAVDAFPEKRFEGEVSMVNRQVDPRTREAAIRVELPNEDGKLRAGMSGKVSVQLGTRRELVVPRNAVVNRDGDSATVFVVESGRAKRRSVEVEAGFDEYLPVAEGLEADEQVVTWGSEQLSDGDAVEVTSGEEGSSEDSGTADDASESGGGTR